MSASALSAADRAQLSAVGISPQEAQRQLEVLRHPPPPLRLVRPCRVGDGIVRLESSSFPTLVERFEEAAAAEKVTRMVPASGAASRMFQFLAATLRRSDEDGEEEPGLAALESRARAGDGEAELTLRFLGELPRFPFFGQLYDALNAQGVALEDARRDGRYRPILRALLEEPGLGLLALPKGLIPFHRGRGGSPPRTAFDDHLAETAACTRDRHGVCRLHLTVAPDHEEAFRRHLAASGPAYEARLGVRFEVTFSHQSPSTDTLAVDLDGRPFRQEDGSLLLRPGGHGALLGNLSRLGTELALIKNVDNILPEERQQTAVSWKKLLGGYLLAVRGEILEHLQALGSSAGNGGETALARAQTFLADKLFHPLPPEVAGAELEARRRYVAERLDRPLRVCGVVANQGEPGGGPFWVESPSWPGEVSLQIVEGSQVEASSKQQSEVFASSTHFNPVDLVCCLWDAHGRPYELERFVDPATVFLAEKSYQGRPLKALERPGLWNGAMAGWNTVFVEVPAETFAPVKTVLDLLRPGHA